MEQAGPADAPFISQDTAELWNQQDQLMHHAATQSLHSALESFLKRWTMTDNYVLTRACEFQIPVFTTSATLILIHRKLDPPELKSKSCFNDVNRGG